MATRTISTKLAVEGEAAYRQAIAACNSELKTLKSDLSLVESEFRNNANSMDALTAKGNALGAVYDKQLEKVVTLETALFNAKQAQDEYASRMSTAQENINRYEQTLEQLRQSTGDTSKEQEECTKELAKWNAELDEAQAGQAAAALGVQAWQAKLNNAKVELNGLSDKIAQNNQYLREAEESADGCAASIDQYGKEVKEAGKSSEEFAMGTEKSTVGIEQLSAALAAAGVAKTVKEITDELLACAGAAAGFETALAKLSTLIDTSVYPMEDIKIQLVELSSETGVAVGALAEAAYQARSAGVDAADVISFVATATKTSVAGFTDSATAVDVLTTALNAYNLEGSESERVASMLVKTQDEGKTSVGELAQNMGRIIPVAAAYNVSLENLTTSYALLTKSGTNTRIATTNLSALLTELAKDGSTVADVLTEQTGKSFAGLMESGQTLGGVMEILADSVDGDAAAFSNLWSSTTAGQAALSLLNSGAEEFNRTLAVMGNSSGAVDVNFQIMADTTEFAQQRMVNAAENLRIAIGDHLNPALKDLYETGAAAFTWATDFVEANPWVVSAVTGLTGALGALSIGVAGLAAAPAVISALGKALTLLSANPIILVTSAVVGLGVAAFTYAAYADAAQESTHGLAQSLQEAKDAYDDLMSSMGEEQASVKSVADALHDLMGVEEKSISQKAEIKRLIDQLNEAYPDLNLAYDEEKDALEGVTEAELDAKIARAQAAEEHEAQINRLSDLRVTHAEITKQLQAAKEQLAGVEANDIDLMNRMAAAYEAAGVPMGTQEEIAASLRGTIAELTAAEADNAAQIAELEAATEAYNQGQGAAEKQVSAMTSTVGGLIAQMEELQTSYQASYDAAYASIDAQLGLFNDLDGEAKTSIDDLIKTLQGQVDYMDTYAANLQRAMELGVDEGLIAKLSDGKEESAQILDAIVKGGEEDIAALNEQFAKVEEGKKNFSDAVGQMEEDFDKKMGEIVEDLNDAIQEMDLQDAAYEIGQNNVWGLIDGTSDPSLRKALVDEYIAMANECLEAYKQTVGQHSPSKEYVEAAIYDVLGLIEGAKAKRSELSATYADLAMAAFAGYKAAAEQGMAELSEIAASFKDLDSYFDVKASVGDLEYQLWERTAGKNATDAEKYAKQQELLNAQIADQQAKVDAATAAWKAVVAQYGEGTAESYEYQKALLEETLALQDLLDEIEQVTAAKQEMALQDTRTLAQMNWYLSGVGRASAMSAANGGITPYEAAQIAGTKLILPDGSEFAAAVEQAVQAQLTSVPTQLPSAMKGSASSGVLERQLENLTAAAVNAISDAAQSGNSAPIALNLMFPDGTKFASYLFDPLVKYADANGTSILNPT